MKIGADNERTKNIPYRNTRIHVLWDGLGLPAQLSQPYVEFELATKIKIKIKHKIQMKSEMKCVLNASKCYLVVVFKYWIHGPDDASIWSGGRCGSSWPFAFRIFFGSFFFFLFDGFVLGFYKYLLKSPVCTWWKLFGSVRSVPTAQCTPKPMLDFETG